MARLLVDKRDIEFILYEQFDVLTLTEKEMFEYYSKNEFDMIIEQGLKLAENEFAPTNQDGDSTGAKWDNGKVTVPPSFHRPIKLFAEQGWASSTDAPDVGGQGLPIVIFTAANEMFHAANTALNLYTGLVHGAGKLVELFGTNEQKSKYLEKIYSYEWAGTMCLTEPGAGSDLAHITTKAVKIDGNRYKISGQKIFITAGDHDLNDNIVHPVLARIEGAPEGTKGISLFLVPKIWVNDDGSLGEANDVVCTGIEEKMGIHGNSTCSLALGGKGQCRGTLLGEENKGMRAMFLMMNEARLLVGLQGFSCASSSYLNAVNYARERIQGKNILSFMDKDAPAVPIIQHPDVRRQLLTMKSYIEGMRSLLYYVAYCEDMIHTSDDQDTKDKFQGLVEVLTPVAKGYVTDKSFEVCSHGMQVYGGYGYIKEYPQEQLLRDCRITLIYEGTNGIQAMDLLGRKLGMNKGKAVMDLMGEVQKTIASAREIEALQGAADTVDKMLNKLGEVAMHMGGKAMSPDVLKAFAHAQPFMEVTGDVVMGWMLLWRATVASQKLEEAKQKDKPFYEGQLKSCEYFTETVLPVTFGKMKAILGTCGAAIDIDESSFCSK